MKNWHGRMVGVLAAVGCVLLAAGLRAQDDLPIPPPIPPIPAPVAPGAPAPLPGLFEKKTATPAPPLAPPAHQDDYNSSGPAPPPTIAPLKSHEPMPQVAPPLISVSAPPTVPPPLRPVPQERGMLDIPAPEVSTPKLIAPQPVIPEKPGGQPPPLKVTLPPSAAPVVVAAPPVPPPVPAVPPALRLLGPYKKHPPVTARYPDPLVPLSGLRLPGADPRSLPAPLSSGQLHLEVVGPRNASAGHTVEYTIVVRNTWPQPQHSLGVLLQLSPGCKVVETEPPTVTGSSMTLWRVDRLAPGQEQRYKVRVQPGPDNEVELRVGSVALSDAELMRTRLTSPPPEIRPAGPEIRVSGPDSTTLGQKFTLQIHLRNPGSLGTGNLELQMNLPTQLQHEKGQEIAADLPELGPGQSKIIELEVTAAQAGRAVVEVALQTSTGSAARAQTTVQIADSPPLVLRKIGAKHPQRGLEQEYTLEVINTSPREVPEVTLQDRLPAGLAFVQASQRGTYDPGNRVVQWNLGPLSSGQMHSVTLRVRPEQAGEFGTVVSARTGQGPEVELAATLLVEDLPPGPVPPGPVPFPGSRK